MSLEDTLTRQLTLDLFTAEPPTFGNFIIGRNAEAVACLRALAEGGDAPPASLVASRAVTLWGAHGVGKTHLLKAIEAANPGEAVCCDADALLRNPFPDAGLLLLDDVDRFDARAQAALFTAFNHVSGAGGRVISTLSCAPLASGLRADLRSRLGSGLVFEILPIPQDELPSVLRGYCAQAGFQVSDDVLAYLLSRHSRDLPSLRRVLRALDRWSLAEQRPVTVPLARAVLAALERG
ncbi:MAG: HdaA/DnaA family protein [Casimicrobiaceae bacterium]